MFATAPAVVVDRFGLLIYIENHSHLYLTDQVISMSAMSSTQTADSQTANPPAAGSNTPDSPPEISSLRLLGGQGLLRIEHRGAVYTLRATSKGGLILTK
jgi:hemin uptake protein HemP